MVQDRAEYLGLGYFVHPLPAAAVFLLVLNDHYLKAHFPGFVTGKVSDFAGLFFFPLFLCALFSLLERLRGGNFWIGPRSFWVALLLGDIIFVSVKVFPTANHLYTEVLFAIGFPSHLVMDVGDLSALSVNILTYFYARRFWRQPIAV